MYIYNKIMSLMSLIIHYLIIYCFELNISQSIIDN